MIELERIPPGEAAQIENIANLTVAQLRRRYKGEAPTLRGVHAKDHGCVTARFTVEDSVPEHLRIGVFATPGRVYEALIRFSNADVLVAPDSTTSESGSPVHGSRGMAVKLLGVCGTPLMPTHGPLTQDFLMINQPVFAFANVEDYEVVSRVLLRDDDKLTAFFAERVSRKPDNTPADDPATRRALRTAGIIKRIQSSSLTANPPAFQEPPRSPLDNRYFSASPFLLGEAQAMKFSATPLAPQTGLKLDIGNPDYLRAGLRDRLMAPDARDVVFDFSIQVRTASELAGKLETDIEDACVEWSEAAHPFVKVASLVIPPQDFDTKELRARCEDFIFTPWHGLVEHRPLGGINRMRRAVYEASAHFRHIPKEPARL